MSDNAYTDLTGSTDIGEQIGVLHKSIQDFRDQMKADLPADRFKALEDGMAEDRTKLAALMEVQVQKDQAARIEQHDQQLKAILAEAGAGARVASKAGAISAPYMGGAEEVGFLMQLADFRKNGTPESYQHLKATLGTSGATGQFLLPNNFVAELIDIAVPWNPYRQLLQVITGVNAKAIDLPYETAAVQRAKLQGGLATSYGSNKETIDVSLSSVTATMAPIAQIRDVGNQFLRQSSGAAEQMVRNQLGKAIGLAEAFFILNGTGTNQPGPGLLVALTAAGANYATNLSGSRAATLGTAIGAVEARGAQATGGVLHPTDFWETMVELGTANGNFMVNPSLGAQLPVPPPGQPQFPQGRLGAGLELWGIPFYRDANLTVGTAIVGDFAEATLFIGQDYTIDTSSEGNLRFDQNVTGFRAEEQIAFNATGYVAAGYFQRVTGI